MDEELLAAHVDAIHAVALADFVAERTARARQLRQDGHRDEAAALGRVRKPTVAAWAVNQLARRHADEVAALVHAGADLRSAQLRATSGRGAEGLRPATRRVRDLADTLATHAVAILAEAGAGDHRDAVQQTLFAAAIDPDLHATLRRGVFTQPVEAAGFGAMAPLAAVPPSAPTDTSDETAGEAEDGGESEVDRARREAEEAAAARRRALEEQRAELQRARVRQQRRHDRARERADDLETRLQSLRTRAEQAATTAAAAAAELADLEAQLAEVEAALAGHDPS